MSQPVYTCTRNVQSRVRIGFKYGLGLTHVIKALSRREGEVGVPAAALAGAAGGRVTQDVPTVDGEGVTIPTTGGTFSGASSLIGKQSTNGIRTNTMYRL